MPAPAAVAPDSAESTAPASYVQRGMWMTAQRNRNAPLNVMILAWRIEGPLDTDALADALHDAVARHGALRTRLEMRQGQLLQVVGAAGFPEIAVSTIEGETAEIRLRAAVAALAEQGRQPLDLASRPPLRVRLLKLAHHDHVLCLFVHHAICDGWSSEVIIRDVAALYGARAGAGPAILPVLNESYADYAARQVRDHEAGAYGKELAYWRSELSGLPAPGELPTVVPRKGNRDLRASSPVRREALETVAALKDFARSRKVSFFSVLLTAVALLVCGRTGSRDIALGVSTVNRWSKDAMEAVGCYTNLLPARIRLRDAATLDACVAETHATIRRLLAYGRVPLELVLRELNSSFGAAPAFPVWCQLRAPTRPIAIEAVGLSISPLLVDRGGILCDLEADFIESERGLECLFAHRAALFAAEYIEGLMHDFGAILAGIQRPGATVGALLGEASA